MTDFLEREHCFNELSALLHLATAGQGRTVLISGEAGIGKTALVEQFVRRQESRATQLWGACEALFTPRPLAPLYDLATQIGGELAELLSGNAERSPLFSALLSALQKCQPPTIVVFEDVHWADEATLDLITFLGRRIRRLPVLLLLTSRDSELSPDHPLRSVIGDLPDQVVARLSLSPLSEHAVTLLAQQAGRSAEGLYAVTGGNPFFVTQLLSGETDTVPLQVRDAIVARLSRLSPAARSLLELLSVVPTRTELWLLETVVRSSEEALEEGLTAGMLELSPTTVAFRHELARLAVESTLSPRRKRALHTKVLQVLLSRAVEAEQTARLVHHARGAQDAELLLRYAPLAARHAAQRGAHRQAVEHYRSALSSRELLSARDHQEVHATLLDGLARECALTGQIQEAFEAHTAALVLWRDLGRTLQVGHTLSRLARYCWRLGRGQDVLMYAMEAVEILSTPPESRELGQAYANLSAMYMVSGHTQEALLWGRRALDVARAFHDSETRCYTLFSMGSALLGSGEQEGQALLEQSLHLAQEQGLEQLAALAYTNLAALLVNNRAYEKATGYLQEGLAYCAQHELDGYGTALQALRARARLEQGTWVGAEEDARAVLSAKRVAVPDRIGALLTWSVLLMRRGEPGVLPLLEEAHALAAESGEMQQIALVATARAEWWWLQGRREACVAAATEGFQAAISCQWPWFLGEVAIWLWRGGGMPEVLEGAIAAPFAREMAGDWRGAAALWAELGCPYEQALALANGDAEAMRQALALLEPLEARSAVALVRQRLEHLTPLGNKPRLPAGLSEREVEVLQLVAQGKSNRDIAQVLIISERTVAHHLTSIFTKLRVDNRAAAVFAMSHHLAAEVLPPEEQ